MCGRSGLLPSLIGVCHVAIQFPLYEYAKAKLAERSGCAPDELPAGQLVTPLHPNIGRVRVCQCRAGEVQWLLARRAAGRAAGDPLHPTNA